MALSIHYLPDDLLGRILALLAPPPPWQRQEGDSNADLTAATLVCKRWCRSVFSEPSLWRRFQIDLGSVEPEQRASQLRLLNRVGGMLKHLRIDCTGSFDSEQVAAMAACLPHLALLECIDIYTSALPPPLLEALPAAPALARASLVSSQLPPNTVDVLSTMPRLRSLSLAHDAVRLVGTRALQRLPQLGALFLRFNPAELDCAAALRADLPHMVALRCLHLSVHGSMPAELVASAAQLQQLTELQLQSTPPMVPMSLPPSCLPMLQILALYVTRSWGVPALTAAQQGLLWPRPGAFPRLQLVDYRSAEPVELETTGISLEACRFLPGWRPAAATEGPPDGATAGLVLEGLQTQQAPEVVLASLTPPASAHAAIIDLELSGCPQQLAESLLACPSLAQLRTLKLTGCGHVQLGGFELPALQSMTIAGSRAPSCALTISSAPLPALSTLRVLGGESGASCSLTISGAALPALAALEVSSEKSAASLSLLGEAALPQLSRLNLAGGNQSTLHLAHVALPALCQLLVPPGFAIRLESVCLGSLHTLRRQSPRAVTFERSAGAVSMFDVRAPALRMLQLPGMRSGLSLQQLELPALETLLIDGVCGSAAIDGVRLPALQSAELGCSLANAPAVLSLLACSPSLRQLSVSCEVHSAADVAPDWVETMPPHLRQQFLNRRALWRPVAPATSSCGSETHDSHAEPQPSSLQQQLAALALGEAGEEAELPEAPWLPAQEQLSLSGDAYTRIPPHLAAATRLHTLSITAAPRLRPSLADVRNTLVRLSALHRLRLPWAQCGSAAVREQLAASMPQLELLLAP